MIAVKYIEGLPEGLVWFSKFRRNAEVLPEGYDELLTPQTFAKFIADNKGSYQQYLSSLRRQNGSQLFRLIREKWQDMADRFAFENANVDIRITTAQAKEVADAFSQVIFYLNANVPYQAVIELGKIQRSEPFLTDDRLTSMASELTSYIQELSS